MNGIEGKIRELLSLAPARRGQLSEQYYKGRLASGKEVVRGPYYVLQWYEGGRKRSQRVRAEDAARVREELERGRRAEALMDEVREGAWRALGSAAQKKNDGGFGEELLALDAAVFAGEDGFDLKTFEEEVRRAVMKEGRRFLEGFLNNALPEMLGLSKVPGAKGVRPRKVITGLGEVTLRRVYTPGRVCPMDRALGLECGCTAEAASMLCFAAAMSESYDKGEAAARKLAGLDVPGRTIQRLVNIVSVQMKAANADTAQEQFPEGSVANTQMDMTGVKVRPEDLEDTKGRDGDPSKKQVKVGVSFRQVRSADGKLHMEKCSIGHLVAFEGPAAFGERMRKWLDGRGLGKCSAHVVTSDGAQWIWDLVETEFPGAVQIVDFYHASEHLMELCRLLHPEEDGAMARKTFDMRRRMLKRNGAACLIRYFEANGPFSPNAAEINDKLDYFRNNESRMRYGEFKKAGYVIGSGAVEGSCRSLVNQRADLSGQWWHPRGAVNILRIRGMIIDGLHEKYWRSRGLAHFRRAA